MAGGGIWRRWRQTLILAWRDAVHEWPVSLCMILALAAVLAPLLVLFGLKSGIVTTMRERLRSDPRTVEISPRGHYRLDAAWFEALRADPAVRFLIPRTRTLSATVSLETPTGQALLDVDMLPTAAGDPLFPPDQPPPEGLATVVLSWTAAAKLAVGPNDPLIGTIARRMDGAAEAVRIPLTLAGVLPEASLPRDGVFVALPLVVATEDYRDGFAVPELGSDSGAQPRPGDERSFASFRLYARDMDDVGALAQRLRAQGLEVVTRSAEIEAFRAIDRVLTFVFLVLAGIGVCGYLLSLATSLWANVDRKRRELALLRLVGLDTAQAAGFPALQALMLALGGTAVSISIYLAIAGTFNAVFADKLGRDEFVCRLTLGDAATAGAMTVSLALLASIVGGLRAASIEPAEGLRAL